MLRAELKKLWSGGAYRVFLCILLGVGVLLPFLRSPDPVQSVYRDYVGMKPDAVTADIDRRLSELKLQQELEILAYLPPEFVQLQIDSITQKYGLTMAELEKLAGEGFLRYTDDIYQEMALLEQVRTHAERSAGYGHYLETIDRQAETILTSSLYQADPYARELALQTARCYDHLAMEQLPLADPTGLEQAMGSWLDDAIACGISAVTALFLFCEDRHSGMLPLLFSTPKGRRATYRAKATLTAAISLGCCVLFAAARLLSAGDLGDLSRPIQTIPSFYTSPYAICAGELLLLSFLQRTLVAIFAGLLMGLMCILLDRPLALGAAALIAAVGILCWTMIDAASWCQLLKYLSLGAMLSAETLWGNAVFVRLGSFPVPFWMVYLIVVVLGGILLCCLGLGCFCRAHLALSLPSRNRRVRDKKRNAAPFFMELGKLLIHQKGAAVLLLLLLLQPFLYETYRSGFTIDELRYLSKMAAVQGPYSDQKQDALYRELADLEAQQATAGPVLAEELSNRSNALQRVIQVGEYLSSRQEAVSYVYEAGHLALLGSRPIGFSHQQSLGMLALCLLLPGLFTQDAELGIDHLLCTTGGINRLHRRKWTIAMLGALTVYLICWMPALYFIFDTFEIGLWAAPAVSIQRLSALPGWLPLWLAFAVVWIGRLSVLLLFSGLLCAAAKRFRRYLPTFLLGSLITFIVFLAA